MKSDRKIFRAMLVLGLLAGGLIAAAQAFAQGAKGRIFVLVVCDGLRPDLVTQQNMPNLFAIGRAGVRFDRHHSLYPTLTMVNAGGLSTGAQPGVDGVLGNTMYFKPVPGAKVSADLAKLIAKPVALESPRILGQLNAPGALAGHLLALDTAAQEAEREGGYIAILGKAGPAFIFDNRLTGLNDGRDLLDEPHKDFLFATDDLIAAPPGAKAIADTIKPPASGATSTRDAFYTTVAIEKALPAAKAAAAAGRPAIIVLWLRDPDATQHRAGLGTVQDFQALSDTDANLGRIRSAIAASGLERRTDLMVVSDHGFATVRMKVDLAGLLVAAGLKKSVDSGEMRVVRNGGSDLIYLSPDEFKTADARRGVLQKIVNFAEAQEWSGPIFSRDPAPVAQGRRKVDYLGWIGGTFNEASVGIYNAARSPDLVISFREFADMDNSSLTGPDKPAFAIDAQGQHAVPNQSSALVHPVKGVNYADGLGTGQGMHGAAGDRELHNFCAAIGPDFRRGYVDRSPTGNADVAPTMSRILGLEPNVGPGGVSATGRVMQEALSDGSGGPGLARPLQMRTDLELQGVRVVTTLIATQLGRRLYLDDSRVERIPLGRSP
ncbi:MAG: alkaline phosphatase family protein [Candidatus Binatales bacterium]